MPFNHAPSYGLIEDVSVYEADMTHVTLCILQCIYVDTYI